MAIRTIHKDIELQISYGVVDTQFGLWLLAWAYSLQIDDFINKYPQNNIKNSDSVGHNEDCWVCFLAYGNSHNIYCAISNMKELWYKSIFIEDSSTANTLITSFFSKNHKPNLLFTGTDFQIKVWNALMDIPFGATVSYEAFAAYLGGKNYTRAAASAIARNNIAYLVPCHRVISKSGDINKYRWGANIKTRLLEWERARIKINNNITIQKLEKSRLY